MGAACVGPREYKKCGSARAAGWQNWLPASAASQAPWAMHVDRQSYPGRDRREKF